MERRAANPGPLELFAACAPGLEELLRGELLELGLSPIELSDLGPVRGGVALRGSLREVLRINLRSRIASRVLVRLGAFKATTFEQLIHEAAKLPFEQILGARAQVALRVTCKKSRLYHSGAVAERVHQALENRLRRPVQLADASEDGDGAEAAEDAAKSSETSSQLILVRFEHDRCTISADASGALLHLRGYRTHASRAPLRETLAAALLRAIGYRGGPLVDPCCGAGTIPLEAAMIRAGLAPNASRSFACESWPAWSGGWIAAERSAAVACAARTGDMQQTAGKLSDDFFMQQSAQQLSDAFAAPPIAGFDLDAKAVAAAQANARTLFPSPPPRVLFAERDLRTLRAPDLPRGCAIVANPPYGERVGDKGEAGRALWAALGKLLREVDGPAALLCPAAQLEAIQRALEAQLRVAAMTQNGGIRVGILVRTSSGALV